MKIWNVTVDGLRRAAARPWLILLLWLVGLLYALPMAFLVRSDLADSFGKSLVSDNMRDGFDRGWLAEFEAKASGVAATFGPTVSGKGPVFDSIENWWSGGIAQLDPVLIGLGSGYAILWAFLLGGVLVQLNQASEASSERFFGDCGTYLLRFVGLGLVSGGLYISIYLLGRRLYKLIESSSRDVTEEKVIFVWVIAAASVVVLLLSIVRMIFDYAKISTVVDGHRNVLRSIAAAGRFVVRNPLRTTGVYLVYSLLVGALVIAFGWVAPGAEQSTATTIVAAFLFSQLYLIARLVLRLGLLGGQTSLYRQLTSSIR